MEIRRAGKEDLEQLKKIWKLCFGDEDRYIDFYFNNRNWMEETMVFLLDGEIVSMLSMISLDIVSQSGFQYRASMLYAIATHPEYQKRGIADKLIQFSNEYLLQKQVPITLLVPAEEELFEFYRKRGYQEGFYFREAILNKEQIREFIKKETLYPCRIIPADPSGYNTKRKDLLKETSYVSYTDSEIIFQKREAQLYQTDIYFIELEEASEKKIAGCAVIEAYKGKIIVKELLVPDCYLASAVYEISEQIEGATYIIRTPSDRGKCLGGEIRPFGMYRFNQEQSLKKDTIPSYLGIAYD